MTQTILCGFCVGVDAVAGRLGSYGSEDSPGDILRGYSRANSARRGS
jgi:peptidoglycan-N-acetylglucosamine deacetylase